eukprot:PITA_25436
MDVKSTFLHGDLHEEIYMEQPTGFIKTDSTLVCRLNKSLYGLKQAPQDWCAKMDSFLLETGFSRCHSDNIVYTKKVGKSLITLVLYVDDLILTASPLFVGFTDSDCAGDPDDWKSTAGYVFTLSSGPITWACKKQTAISLSLAESEYRGAIEARKEAMWLHQTLSEFGFQQQHPTKLWCDNKSAIQLCKDPVQHQHSECIELYMNFTRKLIHHHVLAVQYCLTDDQVADILTKALTEAKFTKLHFMVGV